MQRCRSFFLSCVLLATLAVAACGPAEPEQSESPRPAGPQLTERVQVLAADVLVVDGRHVRLAGVWAPQPIPDARCWAEALAAKQATEAVREMVRQASDVYVAPSTERDAYNRTVTHVTLDRLDLGDSLAQAGLVAVTPDQRFPWCDPISRNAPGAPPVRALMDFGR